MSGVKWSLCLKAICHEKTLLKAFGKMSFLEKKNKPTDLDSLLNGLTKRLHVPHSSRVSGMMSSCCVTLKYPLFLHVIIRTLQAMN